MGRVNDPNQKPFQYLDKIVAEYENYYALQWKNETVITYALKDKFIKMMPNAQQYIKKWEKEKDHD